MATFVQPPCDEAVIRSKRAAKPCAKSAVVWILAATILGSSMAFIDGTVVNVALPAVQARFKATVVDVQWVIEAYSLLLTALLLVGGSLGDRYGRRRIFLAGVTIFSIASAWCGLAGGIHELIIARALQGLGGALLVPASLAIISASFPDEDRGRAIGTWSGFTAITTAIGPVIGGWLIEKISWRAVFFINLPLAVVVLLISWLRVPESRDPEDNQRLDWPGAAAATIGLTALVYALIESSRLGFRNLAVSLALVSAFLFLLAFFIIESRAANPMLPLSLFRSRDFSGANLVTLFLYAALGGTLFFLPLNLIQVQRYSATAAGAALLPFILIMFLLSRWSGGLVASYGAKLPLVVGPVIASLGFALFMVPALGANYWTSIFPGLCVLGLGMAISVAPLTTTVMNSVPANHAGIASGINNAVSRAASLLAIAVFGIVMLHVFNSSFDRHLSTITISPEVRESLDQQRIKLGAIALPQGISPNVRDELKYSIGESFVDGYRRVMLLGATLAFISGIISWLLVTGRKSAS
jgi:EmrB/QacA subfamily drug resistance transporter